MLALCLLFSLAQLAPAAAASPAVRLRGSVPSWVRHASLVRPVPGSAQVTFQVYLGLRDAAAAEQLALDVSDPRSSSYQRFLTPGQFRARFSPSGEAVGSVESWLRSQGFSVRAVAQNRTFVEASGTVSEAERAFAIRMNDYRVNGDVLRAPDTAPEIPSSLASVVFGVGGLDESVRSPGAAAPPALQVAHPCSTYWGEEVAKNKPLAYGHALPYNPCGYTPRQMQGAYGVSGAISHGNDGSGTTIAILDAYHSPTGAKDLRIYSRRNGLPKPDYSELLQRCPCPGARATKQAWYQEQSLDLDAAHAMAPGAKLLYVGTRSDGDMQFLRMTAAIVDRNLADVISNSSSDIGEHISQSLIRAQHQIYVQAAAEGISVLNCTNDYGDDTSVFGYPAVNWPASDPMLTAIGGTSLAIGPLRNYRFETGWGTYMSSLVHHRWRPAPPGFFRYGGGGGTSRLYSEPPYQRGVVPRSLSGRWGGESRVIPDIALDGDPNTGFRFGETVTFPNGDVRYAEYRFGGTSLSTPLLAGLTVLAVQEGGDRLGLLNPALYELAGTHALRDITPPRRTVAVVRADYANNVNASRDTEYSLRTMDQTGTLHTRRGYDDVTGLGSPRGQAFIDALSG